MVQTLTRFWQALERIAGLSGVPAAWQAELGVEFDRVRRFLRPRGGLAASYPRLDGQPWGPAYDVVSHGPAEHVGICPETGERLTLTTGDITLHQLDRRDLGQLVASAIGCEFQWAATELSATHRLGPWSVAPGVRCQVYLTFPLEDSLLHAVVQGLLVAQEGPFLLLAPTNRRFTPGLAAALDNRGASFVALCEAFGLDAAGQFQPTDGFKSILGDCRRRAILARRPSNSTGEPYQFRRQGNVWVLAYAGKTVLMEDARGWHFLHRAVAQPHKPLHVVDLAAGDSRPALGSKGERIDADALAAYKERLAELQVEISEAEQCCDLGRHEELCRQRSVLAAEVAAATGLGGRRRKATDADRFRRQVKMAVFRALVALKPVHPELARHLQQSVQTGQSLCYGPASPIPWVV